MNKKIADLTIYSGERFETEGIFVDSPRCIHRPFNNIQFMPMDLLPDIVYASLTNIPISAELLATGESMNDGGIFINWDLQESVDLRTYDFVEYSDLSYLLEAFSKEVNKRANILGLPTSGVLELITSGDIFETSKKPIELIENVLESMIEESLTRPITVAEAIDILQSLEPILPLVTEGTGLGAEVIDIQYEVVYMGDTLDPQNATPVAIIKQRPMN